jgi:hypothetical protein
VTAPEVVLEPVEAADVQPKIRSARNWWRLLGENLKRLRKRENNVFALVSPHQIGQAQFTPGKDSYWIVGLSHLPRFTFRMRRCSHKTPIYPWLEVWNPGYGVSADEECPFARELAEVYTPKLVDLVWSGEADQGPQSHTRPSISTASGATLSIETECQNHSMHSRV